MFSEIKSSKATLERETRTEATQEFTNCNYYKTDKEDINDSDKKYNCFLGQFETPIYWGNLIGILTLHVLALYGIVTFHIIRDRWEVVYGK